MANLFAKAKAKGATASPKPEKRQVIIKDAKFHLSLSRLAEINSEIDKLSAESNILSAEVKERGIDEFTKIYEDEMKYPGSFNIQATGLKGQTPASFMFIPTDKYIKIGEERAEELQGMFGEDIVEETVKYEMNAKLVEEYGEIISNLIEKCKDIPKSVKEDLISATTQYSIKKGTISELTKLSETSVYSISEILQEIKPVYQNKNIKIED